MDLVKLREHGFQQKNTIENLGKLVKQWSFRKKWQLRGWDLGIFFTNKKARPTCFKHSWVKGYIKSKKTYLLNNAKNKHTHQPKLNNFWTLSPLFISVFCTQVDTLILDPFHHPFLSASPDTSIRAVDSTQKLPFVTNAPRSRRQTESRLASLTPILTPFQR